MEGCYRSTPKLLGAFLDMLYPNPTTLILAAASLSAIADWLWYKRFNKQKPNSVRCF